MSKNPSDVTRPANLQSHELGTGAIRSQRPVYKDFLPPCNNACPAGENIQAWLALVQAGHFKQAWQVIVKKRIFRRRFALYLVVFLVLIFGDFIS
ncbi:MAG: hypothetical protein Q8K07_10280 [Methylicorpusculum sp.]|uniref:hypothetical protein n=1 Tax=Methylicorpusculum sp. TaxID=2713644 RepID=UPI00273119E6|nr:hypothetical protein [Methylicorpusculum sp.]MDP2202394.1 hypothetical protein [Methylicorpusculum sp.]